MEKAINMQRVLLYHRRLFFFSLLKPLSFSSSSSPKAYRTPICKAKRSGFKDTHGRQLLAVGSCGKDQCEPK